MRAIEGVIVIALFLLLIGGCRSADPALFPSRAGDAPAEAIVLDNHWHTAPIFRTVDLPADFRRSLGAFGERRFVSIGWGDEGFYRAEQITPDLIAQALFYSRGSVLLVIGFDGEPEESFDETVDIYRVSTRPQSVDRMIAAAEASFLRKNGDLIDAGPGIDNGRFFAAKGRYAFYHTCNQWTADMLAAGGLPISAAYATTATNVAFQLRRLPGTLKNGLLLAKSLPPRPPLLGRGQQ